MVQKIIKIGSSAGVITPKKQLDELGLKVGDEVKVSLKPVTSIKHQKFLNDLEKFMDIYDQDLKNLAKR